MKIHIGVKPPLDRVEKDDSRIGRIKKMYVRLPQLEVQALDCVPSNGRKEVGRMEAGLLERTNGAVKTSLLVGSILHDYDKRG